MSVHGMLPATPPDRHVPDCTDTICLLESLKTTSRHLQMVCDALNENALLLQKAQKEIAALQKGVADLERRCYDANRPPAISYPEAST